MNLTRRRLLILAIVGLALSALLLGLVGGILVERHMFSAGSSVEVPPGAASEFQLMSQAWRIIEREYVNQDAVRPRRMAHSAISGMLGTLGDVGHTRFLAPELAERHRRRLQGEFEGIGAYVEMREGQVVIVAPIDDSPAQRAGLEPGDVIVQVDGEDVTGLPLDEVVGRVLGPAGTEVTLTIREPESGDTREVTLERAEIDLDLVTWQRLPGTSVAYVRISAFSEGAADELEDVLDEIEEEEISGVLLDLRNNPGGLLNEAVGVVSHLVDSGNVLLRRDAEGQITEEPVREGVTATELPMVALANQGTASAAEIVIGALQDHDRASVVGTTTSGAGTVLNEFSLPDGSIMLLAVEEWLTPDGREIWQEGLTTDVEMALPDDAEPLIDLRFQDLTEQELRNSKDTQLLRALDLLEQ